MLAEAKRAQFVERLREWRANNARIIIYFQTEGEIERFREIMAGTVEGVDFVEGTLCAGILFPGGQSRGAVGCRIVRTIRQFTPEDFCGFDAPNVIAPRLISANSAKAIWLSTLSMGSDGSSGWRNFR